MGRPSPVALGRGKGPRAGGGRLEAPSGQGSLLCMKCLPRTRGGDSPSRLLPRPPVTHHPGSALLEIFAVQRKVCLSFPTAIKVPRRPVRQECGVTESPGLRPRLPGGQEGERRPVPRRAPLLDFASLARGRSSQPRPPQSRHRAPPGGRCAHCTRRPARESRPWCPVPGSPPPEAPAALQTLRVSAKKKNLRRSKLNDSGRRERSRTASLLAAGRLPLVWGNFVRTILGAPSQEGRARAGRPGTCA